MEKKLPKEMKSFDNFWWNNLLNLQGMGVKVIAAVQTGF